MATEEVRMMWVIFLGSGMVFGIAALVLAWIGSRVILSIRRQQKKFEIEDETYNKVKEAIKEWLEIEREHLLSKLLNAKTHDESQRHRGAIDQIDKLLGVEKDAAIAASTQG